MEAAQVQRDYHHPFTPYEIQQQFMNGVYDCLENGKVGIFESPTGTGKSLSLICSSMTWLRDHKRQIFEEGFTQPGNDDQEPSWILEHVETHKRQDAINRRDQQEARLAKIRQKEERAKARYGSGEPPYKRQKVDADKKDADGDEEAAFLLDDYESENEKPTSRKQVTASSEHGLSTSTQALLDKLGLSIQKAATEEYEAPEDELKIFFCSRTHSQLSQFVNELRRVKLPPALSGGGAGNPDEDSDEHINVEEMKHLTLGSRKNLCINSKVNKLGSNMAINERCLELQQSSSSSTSKCQYLPNKENEPLVNEFRDHALARIRDIEDFGKLGKRIGICPYYASRAAVKPSEIVTLPYPLLLQKSAREALDLSLKDHVVIIDEAHNLMDAIANIHSVSISLDQLKKSRAQLGIYLQKFRNKLKGKNRVYVTQLVRLIDSLAGFLEQKASPKAEAEGQAQHTELMGGKAMDQVNLYKLTRYVQESKIARKVERYLVHTSEQEAAVSMKTVQQQPRKPTASTPVLTLISEFLKTLTNPSAEGRFFYARTLRDDGSADVTLRYLLLDPTEHFREIVSEARAVILAGGTVSPMGDYINHFFHYLPLERISTLSCGHVIPKDNLIAMPVVEGPNGVDLDFTFEKRGDKRVIEELGKALVQLARTVPDGLVVFFPSYAYLDTVTKAWQLQGSAGQNIWAQLSSIKRVFMEPKSTSSDSANTPGPVTTQVEGTKRPDQTGSKVDTVLQAYTAHIHSSTRTDNGALLLAVIGGSLSEGINFSDRLGRGIVVVGLPFPNARTAEWKAKLEFEEQRSRGASRVDGNVGNGSIGSGAGRASREYLENTCMRAVNQSVGRAIRHKDDYAAILLLDRRYERANIRLKLPGWIKESFAAKGGWSEVVGALSGFFDGKK